MFSRKIKSFSNIPGEFPLKKYLMEYHSLYCSDSGNFSREQFFRRFKFYQSFFFDKLLRFHHLGSNVPLDIFIPVIKKDLDVLPFVVMYARMNVMHPISGIYIIAPASEEIKEVAAKLNCIFIDEKSVLGYSRERINYYIDGRDASGWIFQQLLKLNSGKVCSEEHILILDCDTLIIKPKKFEFKGKYIVEFSNEFTNAYFETYYLLTRFKHRMPVSFICHHMLFRKSILIELHKHIEHIHQRPWDAAIIDVIGQNEQCSFSEYETYANFVLDKAFYPVIFEYWFNESMKKNDFIKNGKLILPDSFLIPGIKTISFHSYNM